MSDPNNSTQKLVYNQSNHWIWERYTVYRIRWRCDFGMEDTTDE